TGRISTMIDDANTQAVNGQAYYQPAVFRGAAPFTLGNYEYNLIESPFKPMTAFILPIYVGDASNINSVTLSFDGEEMEDPVENQAITQAATCTGFEAMFNELGHPLGNYACPSADDNSAGRWCVNNFTGSDGQNYTVLLAI